MRRKTIALAVLVGGLTTTSHAALLAYEGFDYTPGDALVGKNGGTGLWAGTAWALQAATSDFEVGPGLSYTHPTAGYTIAGIGGAASDPNGSGSSHRDIVRTLPGISTYTEDGDTIWFSLLANLTLSTELRLQTGTNASLGAAVSVRRESGIDYYGAGVNSAGSVASNVQVGGVHFVVGRIVFAAGNDTYDLWVDPEGISSEAALGRSVHLVANVGNNNEFDRLRLQSNIGAVNHYDEFRLGEALADVVPVPEPGSACLLSLGAALGFLGRRRRLAQ